MNAAKATSIAIGGAALAALAAMWDFVETFGRFGGFRHHLGTLGSPKQLAKYADRIHLDIESAELLIQSYVVTGVLHSLQGATLLGGTLLFLITLRRKQA